MPGRGCTDQVHNVLRTTLELPATTVMCFVDFESGFDSVERDSSWWIMAADGMPSKLLRQIKVYYASTKMKVRASGSYSMPFEIRSGVRQKCDLSPTLFNYIIECILDQALQDYTGVQVGADVHVSDLACTDDIVIFSSSYSEMQGLLEAVNRHAAAVGMCINVLKTKVMSAPIPGEQRQVILFDGEPLDDTLCELILILY